MSLCFSTSDWLTLDQCNILLLNCSLPAWYHWRKSQAYPVWSYHYVTVFFSGSFSFHLVPGFPITTCRLYYHSPPVPFCTPAPSVLAEILVSYNQWHSVMHELYHGPSYSPPFHHLHICFFYLRASLVCSFPKLTLPSALKISSPAYHLKTWVSIIPFMSFQSFLLHAFILLSQQTY